MMKPVTEELLNKFVAAAQEKVSGLEGELIRPESRTVLSFTIGPRYARIVKKNPQGSLFCFVDMTNGDVLKGASWKTPAKGARSNIHAEDIGLSGITQYGAAYLSR